MSVQQTVSFIIPAYNEAEHIVRTIRSVFDAVPAKNLAEVVVCDHGSTDDTRAMAAEAGADVHRWNDGTIAQQRNRGAELTTGDVLVFLDADTALSPSWGEGLPALFARLEDDPLLVTGSHPAPPEDGGWLERHWFANLAEGADARHLGSAHLILTRAHFEQLGGFDSELETGEDFDLCHRAASAGATVAADQSLPAVHYDFPKTIKAFVEREAWHGRGNFANLRMALASPVSVATIAFTGLHAVALRSARRRRLPWRTGLAIATLCALSSAYKFRDAPLRSRVVNAGVFYFYYTGRSRALREAAATSLRSVLPEFLRPAV